MCACIARTAHECTPASPPALGPRGVLCGHARVARSCATCVNQAAFCRQPRGAGHRTKLFAGLLSLHLNLLGVVQNQVHVLVKPLCIPPPPKPVRLCAVPMPVCAKEQAVAGLAQQKVDSSRSMRGPRTRGRLLFRQRTTVLEETASSKPLLAHDTQRLPFLPVLGVRVHQPR